MNLEEGCHSLKLESVLRGVGFIQLEWRVLAHAGSHFILPVGWSYSCGPEDDLLGFQILERIPREEIKGGIWVNKPFADTAKKAFELALSRYEP